MKRKNLLYVIPIVLAGQVIWLFGSLEFSEKLGLEGVVLAIAAVLLAVQHSNELDAIVNELRGVAQSVPTRGIGVFPSYMPEVAKLVGEAEESIKVLCDTPAHGAFSHTTAFEDYWSKLQHKMVDGLKIECTFFDPPGREQLHRAQIEADEDNWEGWQARNRKNCEAFASFARQNNIAPPSSGKQPQGIWADTPDTYVKSMMAINGVVQSTLEAKLSHFELLSFAEPLHEGPTVYFWLRDKDQEAVFVIVPVRGIGVRDLAGFRTKEPELIRALSTVYEHRQEDTQGRAASPADDAQE